MNVYEETQFILHKYKILPLIIEITHLHYQYTTDFIEMLLLFYLELKPVFVIIQTLS